MLKRQHLSGDLLEIGKGGGGDVLVNDISQVAPGLTNTLSSFVSLISCSKKVIKP